MRPCQTWKSAGLLLLMLAASGARAAGISYLLDQSNGNPWLADGAPYLEVHIAEGSTGTIDFTVSLLPSLTDIAGDDFGLKSFAFSSQGAANILFASNFTGLPSGWSVSFGRSVGDFGSFDVLVTRGSSPPVAAALSFSITGLAADSIADYAVLSRGRAAQGHVFFAAHVGGFLDQDPGKKTLTRAWFGGSTPLPAVPLPAAHWLFLTAIGMMAGLRRLTAGRQPDGKPRLQRLR